MRGRLSRRGHSYMETWKVHMDIRQRRRSGLGIYFAFPMMPTQALGHGSYSVNFCEINAQDHWGYVCGNICGCFPGLL